MTLTKAPEAPQIETAAPEAAAPASPTEPANDRARDDKGRFADPSAAPKPSLKVAAAQPGKPAPSSTAPAAAAAPVSPETKPVRARPSTWRKEMDSHWATLPGEVQDEILRREGDFAKGVSTYKGEFDRLKPFDEVVQRYMPVLQQHGLDPVQHVDSLLRAHQTLALAAPEQKLAMFAQLAQQYGVPLQNMFVRGQDGQPYFNQQLLNQSAPQPQQAQRQAPDYRSEIRAALLEERAQTELQQFEAQAQEKYPHYQQVKATMSQLLDSGLADDLPSAYEAALRHPRHAELYEASQQQARQADEQRQAQERAAVAQRARANALSPRSAAPTGASNGQRSSGVRGALEAAFDEHA